MTLAESLSGREGTKEEAVRVLVGDVLDHLRAMPSDSVDCVVTSPPYWGLRDYGHEGQIGLEPTPQEFVAKLVEVFEEVRRVLKPSGTCWVNLGDSYASNPSSGGVRDTSNRPQDKNAGEYQRTPRREYIRPGGLKPKDLCGIPWRVAFALQEDGWYLRQDIIWHKPNPMPESVRDRCTKSHEYVFLLTKSERYFYDADAISEAASFPKRSGRGRDKYAEAYRETGDERMRTKAGLDSIGARETRNKRSVWTISTQGFDGAHFATFPEELPRLCISAGCPVEGVVLDPFAGSGTTLAVALTLGRRAVGIELNPEYAKLIRKRIDASNLALPNFAAMPQRTKEEAG